MSVWIADVLWCLFTISNDKLTIQSKATTGDNIHEVKHMYSIQVKTPAVEIFCVWASRVRPGI